MLMVVAFIIAFMFGRYAVTSEAVPKIIGVTLSVMIIYVLVTFFGWLIDLKTASRMNEDLKRFQEKASAENS